MEKQLRKLQIRELEMLKIIVGICEKYNLTYFAAGGTLLGAVRHGGFIPWDDDIDLEMLRSDYDTFIKVAPNELPEYMELETYSVTPSCLVPFIKIYDRRTKIVLNYASKPIETSLFVDIFPFDGMPKTAIGISLYKVKILLLRLIRNYSNMDNIHMNRVHRPLHEQILIKFGQITHIGRLFNTVKIIDKTEELLRKYDAKNTNFLFSNYGVYKFKEIMPYEYYGEGKKYNFEDIKLNGPVAAEKVLTQLYGDYMKLPPENERQFHHGLEIIEI